MIGYRAIPKHSFFDADKVLKEMGRTRDLALKKAGAFIRKRARSLLRRRKRSSHAGQPPSVHSRDSVATLKAIFFSHDQANDSVVVGPLLLHGRYRTDAIFPGTTLPATLEEGGRVGLIEHQLSGGLWQRVLLRRTERQRRKRVRWVRVAPRPFMEPAFAAEQPHFAELFRQH